MLLPKILLRRLNHFGYGEEKLRDYYAYDNDQDDISPIRAKNRCEQTDKDNKCTHDRRDYSQSLKKLAGTINRIPVIAVFLHNVICMCEMCCKDNRFSTHSTDFKYAI